MIQIVLVSWFQIISQYNQFGFFCPQVNVDYTEQTVSISNYPLSAALTCAKICSAFEEVWGVL